jgi:hypothetical protein
MDYEKNLLVQRQALSPAWLPQPQDLDEQQ